MPTAVGLHRSAMAMVLRSRMHSSSRLQWTPAPAAAQLAAQAMQLQTHLYISSRLQQMAAAVLAGVAAVALQLLRRRCSSSSSRLQWGQYQKMHPRRLSSKLGLGCSWS